MTVQLHNASLSLAFNGIQAAGKVEKSVAKLTTGKKHLNAKEDSGGFEQAIRIEHEQKLASLSIRNLQNLISYTQMQEGALGQAADILQRMNTLSQLALDVTKTDTDRTAYNHEFVELAEELNSIKDLTLNGINLFEGDPVYLTINDQQFKTVPYRRMAKISRRAILLSPSNTMFNPWEFTIRGGWKGIRKPKAARQWCPACRGSARELAWATFHDGPSLCNSGASP